VHPIPDRASETKRKPLGGCKINQIEFIMRINHQKTTSNVYDWLEKVRTRPLMYIEKDNLYELELLISGYYTALHQHHIDENVPPISSHFLDWLRHHKNWTINQGWAKAIYSNLPKNLSALDKFFTLVDEYRQLKPERLAQIILTPTHHSINKSIKETFPNQMFIVQYTPEHLFFLEAVFTLKSNTQSHLVDKPDKVMELAYKQFQTESTEWTWL
jgi:hypothetical protein